MLRVCTHLIPKFTVQGVYWKVCIFAQLFKKCHALTRTISIHKSPPRLEPIETSLQPQSSLVTSTHRPPERLSTKIYNFLSFQYVLQVHSWFDNPHDIRRGVQNVKLFSTQSSRVTSAHTGPSILLTPLFTTSSINMRKCGS